MKIVRVIYTVRPAFVKKNQENIAAIVAELKSLGHPGIKYSAWLLADGKTFMHFDHFENESAHQILQSLSSFKKFDEELSGSEWEVAPELQLLNLVAATESYF